MYSKNNILLESIYDELPNVLNKNTTMGYLSKLDYSFQKLLYNLFDTFKGKNELTKQDLITIISQDCTIVSPYVNNNKLILSLTLYLEYNEDNSKFVIRNSIDNSIIAESYGKLSVVLQQEYLDDKYKFIMILSDIMQVLLHIEKKPFNYLKENFSVIKEFINIIFPNVEYIGDFEELLKLDYCYSINSNEVNKFYSISDKGILFSVLYEDEDICINIDDVILCAVSPSICGIFVDYIDEDSFVILVSKLIAYILFIKEVEVTNNYILKIYNSSYNIYDRDFTSLLDFLHYSYSRFLCNSLENVNNVDIIYEVRKVNTLFRRVPIFLYNKLEEQKKIYSEILNDNILYCLKEGDYNLVRTIELTRDKSVVTDELCIYADKRQLLCKNSTYVNYVVSLNSCIICSVLVNKYSLEIEVCSYNNLSDLPVNYLKDKIIENIKN